MSANLVSAATGFLLFALFTGFLAIKIATPPLLVIVVLVLVLCLYDFVRSFRAG